jgi:hypothetical protein
MFHICVLTQSQIWKNFPSFYLITETSSSHSKCGKIFHVTTDTKKNLCELKIPTVSYMKIYFIHPFSRFFRHHCELSHVYCFKRASATKHREWRGDKEESCLINLLNSLRVVEKLKMFPRENKANLIFLKSQNTDFYVSLTFAHE